MRFFFDVYIKTKELVFSSDFLKLKFTSDLKSVSISSVEKIKPIYLNVRGQLPLLIHNKHHLKIKTQFFEFS